MPRLFAHDENKKPIYQGLSLADIQIEKLVFVKLSQALNEQAGDLAKLIELSKVCITHVLLSGTGGQELTVIAKEMEAFATENLGDRLQALRFKATLERGIRLAQSFSTTVTETF